MKIRTLLKRNDRPEESVSPRQEEKSAPAVRPISPAKWPYRLPDHLPAAEVEQIRQTVERLTQEAQYGWGHTIDFGPFRQEGILAEHYLLIAGCLDQWGWWPP